MEITELRIGNILNYHGKLLPVISIDEFDIELTTTGYGVINEVTPIELTPEILVKCGFEKAFTGYQKNISRFNGLELKTLFIDFSQGSLIRQGEVSQSRHLDDLVAIYNIDLQGKITLHWLQNCFYSLTGKELEVKL